MIFHEDWWYLSRLSKMSAGIIRQTIQHFNYGLWNNIFFSHKKYMNHLPLKRFRVSGDTWRVMCVVWVATAQLMFRRRAVSEAEAELRCGAWVIRGVLAPRLPAQDCISWAEGPRIAEDWADTDTGTQTSIRPQISSSGLSSSCLKNIMTSYNIIWPVKVMIIMT